MNNTWIVSTARGEVASLIAFLGLDSIHTTALVVGSRALAEEASRSVGEVKWIDDEGEISENYTEGAVGVLCESKPEAIIGVATPGVRAILGAASVKMGATMLSNTTSVSVNAGVATVEHTAYSDTLFETFETPSPVVLLVSGFTLEEQTIDGEVRSENIEQIAANCGAVLERLAVEPTTASCFQNAQIIVGVGLGAVDGDLLTRAQQLADVIGAEIGCSMPVYSERNLLPHGRYIGLSGASVAPKLYLGLGISGKKQHRVGLRNAKTVVCVNNDPDALFFSYADYGIVGDVAEVIPELERALRPTD